MKKLVVIALLLVVGIVVVFMSKLSQTTDVKKTFVRIHIRANSNLTIDQNVKYKVKDGVVNYLTPLFLDCSTKEQAQNIISNNLYNIKQIADNILKQNGFNYCSNAKLNNEYFPTRSYDGVVLESGFYDALIVELGSGEGDNWWCVVYPPLCFVENQQNVVYKSKFLEIIKKILNK